METLLLTLHVIVCVFLVVLVLLQAGKEGMGVIFGGGNASVFGSSGAGGLLTKLTTFVAVLFVITSLSYNVLTNTANQDDSSILDIRLENTAAPTAPTTPETVAPTTPEVPTTQVIESQNPTVDTTAPETVTPPTQEQSTTSPENSQE